MAIATGTQPAEPLGHRLPNAIICPEYDNEKGFALISSNPASETPVLAVIDDGTFDEAVNAGNPGFDSFLSTTSNRIKGTQPAEPLGHRLPNAIICPQSVFAVRGDTRSSYKRL